MLNKLIRSMSKGNAAPDVEANEMAAITLRKMASDEDDATPKPMAEPLKGSGSWDHAYDGGQEMTPLPRPKPRAKAAPQPTEHEAPQRVAIHPVPIMNKVEMRLFHWLFDKLESEAPLFSIHAHVSMDAFLHVDRRAAERDQHATRDTFAQKRVDYLVLDDRGLPIVAIEYHGEKHSRRDTKQCDLAKSQALDEAGVPLLVVPNGATPTMVWDALYPHLEEELEDA